MTTEGEAAQQRAQDELVERARVTLARKVDEARALCLRNRTIRVCGGGPLGPFEVSQDIAFDDASCARRRAAWSFDLDGNAILEHAERMLPEGPF